MKLLLDRNAGAESKDNLYGRMPLSCTARNGHEVVPSETATQREIGMESNKMARHCFLENANIKSKRNSGWTLLSWGAETDCKAVVQERQRQFKNNSGRLPLSQAARGSIETAT